MNTLHSWDTDPVKAAEARWAELDRRLGPATFDKKPLPDGTAWERWSNAHRERTRLYPIIHGRAPLSPGRWADVMQITRNLPEVRAQRLDTTHALMDDLHRLQERSLDD
mgnify:CR=1 FL=1